MRGLREYIVQECLKRFLSRKFLLSPQSDITPLIDFLTHLLIKWMKKVYPYYTPIDEITNVKLKLMSKLLGEIEKHGEISVNQIADMLVKIYEEDISPHLKLRLRSKGIIVLREYENIRVILKSKLRYEALKLLTKSWMSARVLSERLECREEVIRRFLSDMKKLNIVIEQAQISSQGRPVKVYKLATPIIVIDLRRTSNSNSSSKCSKSINSK